MVKVRAYLSPISSDSEKIKELQNTIDNLNEQIKGYLLNIQDLESQVNVKDSLLEAKESEINAKVLEIGELQGQITLLTADKETMQNNIDELTNRVNQLEDEVETLNSIIEDYQSQIEMKNTELSTLRAEKTQLTQQIAELEEQLANSGSSEELEAANARIAELEGQVSALTNDKTNLQTQLNTLQNSLNDFIPTDFIPLFARNVNHRSSSSASAQYTASSSYSKNFNLVRISETCEIIVVGLIVRNIDFPDEISSYGITTNLQNPLFSKNWLGQNTASGFASLLSVERYNISTDMDLSASITAPGSCREIALLIYGKGVSINETTS